MIMTADPLLIDAASLSQLKSNYFTYLNTAIASARQYAPGGPAPQQAGHALVLKWFGAQASSNAIVAGLAKLKQVAQDYTVGGKTYQRKIAWTKTSGSDLHSNSTLAAAYAYGVTDMNKHFELRIYSGLALKNASLNVKVNTMYHELSHRVLGTADVSNAVCHGVNANECYGCDNCTDLANADVADSLRNASNWAFFICEANGILEDTAPRP